MPKHEIPGMGLLPIPPQIRPDKPIPKKTPPHYHPLVRPDGYVPVYPEAHPKKGKPLPEKWCSTAWEMRRHILSSRGHHPEALQAAAARGYDTPRNIRELIANADRNVDGARESLMEILEEAAPSFEREHVTVKEGKYMLTITPTEPWTHRHRDYKTRRGYANHVRKHHPDGDVHEKHRHPGVEIEVDLQKYPERSPGARLNMSPLLHERLEAGDYAFALHGIEGTHKGMAGTAAVLDNGYRAIVYDVPAVGQWRCAELPAFIEKHLRPDDIPVVICPDADWIDNPAVIAQATLCRFEYEDAGVRACIAAPALDENGNVIHKGVDDYLSGLNPDESRCEHPACGGHDLLDMHVVGLSVVASAYRALEERLGEALMSDGRRRRRDGVAADVRTMKGLALLGGPGIGDVQAPLRAVARFIGCSPDQVQRAVRRLVAAGELVIDGTLTTQLPNRRTRRFVDRNLDWKERPTIIIKDRALVAHQDPPIRLKEWLMANAQQELQSAARERVTIHHEHHHVHEHRVEIVGGAAGDASVIADLGSNVVPLRQRKPKAA